MIRYFSWLFPAFSCLVFSAIALSGFMTWRQDFYVRGASVHELVLSFIELVVLIPGAQPLIVAIYFSITMKSEGWLFLLLGIAATVAASGFHFIATVYAIHANMYSAFLLSVGELLAAGVLLILFHRYVRRDMRQ